MDWHRTQWEDYMDAPEGMGSFSANWTRIGCLARQKLRVNTARIYGQPLGMRQLLCVRILDTPTFCQPDFAISTPIMSPWTSKRTNPHRGGLTAPTVHLNVLTKRKRVTWAFCLLETLKHKQTWEFEQDAVFFPKFGAAKPGRFYEVCIVCSTGHADQPEDVNFIQLSN